MSDKRPTLAEALAQARALPRAARLRLIAALSGELADELGHDAAGPRRRVLRPGDPHSELLVPNGIDVETGEPPLVIDAAMAGELARAGIGETSALFHTKRLEQKGDHLGQIYGRSYMDLATAGWALVVHADDTPRLLEALWPLVVHRAAPQTISLPEVTFDDATCAQWLARYVDNLDNPWGRHAARRMPVFLYREGQDATSWLAEHGVFPGPVDTQRFDVPFYLLIAGRPGAPDPTDRAVIPFSFQYDLDIFWGVGRLGFTNMDGEHDLEGYAAYARQLVAFEERAEPPYGRHMLYFATSHRRDRPTQASEEQLVLPLAQGNPDRKILPLADELKFTQDVLTGPAATRAQLSAAFSGRAPQGKPALIFSATHGARRAPSHPRMVEEQGALVCAEYGGTGQIKPEHWMAADSLPAELDVTGLMVVCFACYGAGCPASDSYAVGNTIALANGPYDIVARLPQRLLKAGAIAWLGHVDIAWNYSFSLPELKVGGQTQSFEDLLRALLQGERFGYATDQLNLRQAAFAGKLAELIKGLPPEGDDLAVWLNTVGKAWVGYQDVRGYVLLGDPAARLPFAPAPGRE